LKWLDTHTTTKTAWAACERGDWMLWLLGRLSGKPGSNARRKLVLCVCECARLAMKHVKKGEKRPLKAIETAEAWARREGGVLLSDVQKSAASAAANAATASSYTYAAVYAAASYAYAASYAAVSAAANAAAASASSYTYAAVYAAASYAYAAASAAADASAAYAAYAAARLKTLKHCADIVRKHYPNPPRISKP